MRRHLALSLYVMFGVTVIAIASSSIADIQKCVQDNSEHFHAKRMGSSILRRNDNYRIACWLDPEVKGICKSLELRLEYKQSVITSNPMPNGTGIYADITNAEPRHLNDRPVRCWWGNHTTRTPSFTIGEVLNVTDFACKYTDYGIQEMSCSFNTPLDINYVDNKTRYSLQYGSTMVNCTKKPGDNMLVECTLPWDSYSRSTNSQQDFRIIMIDNMGSQEQNRTLNQLEMIVLPQPGIDAVQNIATNSICLEWENKNIKTSAQWKVQIMEELDRNFTWQRVGTRNTLREAYCLTGLPHSYREYTLNVTRRLINGKYWSPEFIHKFTTSPERPSHPPTLWPGGYQYTNDGHQLLVYWQQLDPLEYNGPNFTYHVIVLNDHDQTEVQNLSIHIESNFAIIGNLASESGDYKVLVHSQNSEGLSRNSSHILVSNLKRSIRRRPLYMTIDKAKEIIEWNEPLEIDDLLYYTIFSCISNASNRSRCLDSTQIEAEKVSIDRRSYKSPKVSNDSYIWAVSAIYNQGSGDMVWYNNTHVVEVSSNSLHGIEGIVALLLLGIFAYALFQKVKYMAGIRVELPPGVLVRYDLKDSDQCDMPSIPGSFSPTVILTDSISTNNCNPRSVSFSTSLPLIELTYTALPGTTLQEAVVPSKPKLSITYTPSVEPPVSDGYVQPKVTFQPNSNGYVSMQNIMPKSQLPNSPPSEYVSANM